MTVRDRLLHIEKLLIELRTNMERAIGTSDQVHGDVGDDRPSERVAVKPRRLRASTQITDEEVFEMVVATLGRERANHLRSIGWL